MPARTSSEKPKKSILDFTFRDAVRLIRFPNLLIVAFTQYLLEFLVLIPAFTTSDITPILDYPRFLLLVISTMLIAAGGYVINDIEDVEIDKINKPEKQIVSATISLRAAWIYYFALFAVGFFISLYLAVYIDNLPLLGIYPSAWLLLYLYSKYFKKMPLIGNIVVGIFCALVAGIVWFAERAAYFNLGEVDEYAQFKVYGVFLAYLFFAFFSTLYREIIKDIEDAEGDAEQDCKTLPIVAGVGAAKLITALVGLIFLTGVGCLAFYIWSVSSDTGRVLKLLFILIFLVSPTLYSLYLLKQGQEKKDYKRLSQLAKFLMLSGIFLLFLL